MALQESPGETWFACLLLAVSHDECRNRAMTKAGVLQASIVLNLRQGATPGCRHLYLQKQRSEKLRLQKKKARHGCRCCRPHLRYCDFSPSRSWGLKAQVTASVAGKNRDRAYFESWP